MDSSWWSRAGLVVAVTLGCLIFLTPTYYSLVVLDRASRSDVKKLEEALPGPLKGLARYRINLGLDLQGGIHMVMQVDTKTALQKKAERRALTMAGWVNETKKLGQVTATADAQALTVTLTAQDPATMDAIEKEVVAYFTDFSKERRNGAELVLRLSDSERERFVQDSLDSAMLVIRKRIDKWGVAEVDVRKLGTDSVQISLPGQKDPEQAKELVGTTAQLEFRIVDTGNQVFDSMFKATPPPEGSGIALVTVPAGGDEQAPPAPFLEGPDREALMAYVKDKVPADKLVLPHCVEAPGSRKQCSKYQTYLLDRKLVVTGENLTAAEPSIDNLNNPMVVFEFNAQGAKEFEELTGKNVGRQLAIVLDDNVFNAPSIREKIGARGQITLGRGGDMQARRTEAQLLALTLKSGALPAPVSIGEVRQVGASLGEELIRKGSLAAVVGLLIVLLFMAVYYRTSGLVADVALVLNGLMILAGLSLFNATLTLPGIAGFVLTLGIAVDANVLINERVREELAQGKSAQVAVDNGYDRVFWTIFDAHVTTLIAGALLQQFGTGPVQGFATTLIIGIIASLYTSIVVTRVITTYLVHGLKARTVSV